MNIKDKAKSIRMVLGREVDILNVESLMQKLNDLINISGLSAEIVPHSKLEYRNAQERVILDLMENPVELSASTTNDLIKSRTGKEESFYDYCLLLDKRLSYSIDGLRTMISLRKCEIENGL